MHLRCDDDKPCARCKKKSIACEPIDSGFDLSVPSTPPSFSIQRPVGNQHSDVAAAEDLLRLSDNQIYHQSSYHQVDTLNRPSMPQSHSTGNSIDFGQNGRMIHRPEVLLQNTFGSDNLSDPEDPFSAMFPFSSGLDSWNNRSLFNYGGMETSFELSDTDFSFLDAYNTDIPFDYQMLTPPDMSIIPPAPNDPHRAAALGHEAFKQSCVWRWKPNNQDNGRVQQQDLDLPSNIGQRRVTPLGGRKLHEKLDARTRDKVLALVVSSCNGEGWTHLPPWPRWIGAFPSTELLDGLVQYCLTAPIAQCDMLFHTPTMSVRQLRPELVLALVAVGAVLTPDSALNKLGMALQELVRQVLPRAVSDPT